MEGFLEMWVLIELDSVIGKILKPYRGKEKEEIPEGGNKMRSV